VGVRTLGGLAGHARPGLGISKDGITRRESLSSGITSARPCKGGRGDTSSEERGGWCISRNLRREGAALGAEVKVYGKQMKGGHVHDDS